MWWPLCTAVLLFAVFAVHIFWRKKFSLAVDAKESELARVRELQREVVIAAEAQQRTLLDSMVEGLLLLDNEGHIRLGNRALENLFSVNSSIYGKTIIEAFRNHQLAELANRLQRERQILGFEVQSSEIPPRWFQVNASTITDGNSKPNGMVFVYPRQPRHLRFQLRYSGLRMKSADPSQPTRLAFELRDSINEVQPLRYFTTASVREWTWSFS